MIKASDQFNLRLSLKKYFKGGEDMADVIINTKNDLRNKISQKKTSFLENDKQYFFAVGQLVSCFISRSKGKKKPLSLANPFINAKNDKMIKDKLKALYKKYNYDIDNYMYKFKGLYAMTISYELDNDNIDQDLIIVGYLHSNLLYEEVKSGE
jgi:CRISPR-associated protein Csh1